MRDKAIEPSEIIIDGKGLPKETVSHVNPNIRFLARFIDYSLLLLLLWGIRVWVGGSFPLSLFEYFIPFEFFVWIPIEACLLSTWGTTPGKFFLRTRLQQGRKVRLDFFTALKRSFNVWFRGLGMGIPGINFICMLIASHRLKIFGQTSWDREDNIVVSHYPTAKWRVIIAFLLVVCSFISYYTIKQRAIYRFHLKGTHSD